MADEVRTVPAHLDGERVDKVLAELFDLSRSRARALAEQGVTIDGEEAGPSDRVRSGQEIGASSPEVELVLVPEPVQFGILYEDEDLVVVDKPPGLVVHPGAGNRGGTLAAGLLHRFPELAGVGPPGRAGLVHRLDKDTSGALLVARSEAGFDALTRALRARKIERVYLALVEGIMAAPTGTVEAPIGRDPVHATRRAVSHGGKPARTHYRMVEELTRRGLSLLEVRLETGRTHQIRVHLAAISHPVAGDRVYGTLTPELPRMFLHAARLGFDHPRREERIEITSELPRDLATALDALRTG
ncbi:MAG: RluA family pseudouridine synthase [Actinobacteria bacterium]|nr:RluA family pseudouridine synthase [Actinomycetota bacterium]